MKKKILLSLAGIMVVSCLTACGSEQKANEMTQTTGTINTFGLVENTRSEDEYVENRLDDETAFGNSSEGFGDATKADENADTNLTIAEWDDGQSDETDDALLQSLGQQGIYQIYGSGNTNGNHYIMTKKCGESPTREVAENDYVTEYDNIRADEDLCDALDVQKDKIFIKPVTEQGEYDYSNFITTSAFVFAPMNDSYKDYIKAFFAEFEPDYTVTDEALQEYETFYASMMAGDKSKSSSLMEEFEKVYAEKEETLSEKDFAYSLCKITGKDPNEQFTNGVMIMTDYEIYDKSGNSLGKLSAEEIMNL